jgi:protein SCO1/2
MKRYDAVERHADQSRQTPFRSGTPAYPSFRAFLSVCVLSVLSALSVSSPAAAQPSSPKYVPPPGKVASEQIPLLKDVGIDQKLDGKIPLDLPFTDESGKDVTIGQYFAARPVVLALVYYECPMLCTQVLQGLVGSLQGMSFTVGKEFDVLVVSFDPGETPALAADRRQYFLKRYGQPDAATSVHFLTGRESSITALTAAVGFRYAYDAQIDQFAHPAAITVLTSDARISRYLYGIEFAPRDLKLALVEAGDGRIGSVVDQMLLFCYHYDPETGKYGLVIMNLVRLAGALTVLTIAAWVFWSLRRERRQPNAVRTTATGIR